MSNDIEICSNALLLLGHDTISSFTEGTTGSKVAANLYPLTYRSLLSSHRWRFAVGKMTLSRLVDVPLNEWTYAYQLPADYINAIKVYPASDYEIYEDKLYSNMNTVDLDYIFEPEESKLPPYFEEALELRLASKFAFPVTSNKSTGDLYNTMFEMQLRKAKFLDSQARPQVALQESPFIDVRG